MIELLIDVAGLGFLLVWVLYVAYRAIDRTLQLKGDRSRNDERKLLNHAVAVGDGIVIDKNGALFAGWEYDNASTTDTQPDIVSERVTHVLALLGTGWKLHRGLEYRAFHKAKFVLSYSPPARAVSEGIYEFQRGLEALENRLSSPKVRRLREHKEVRENGALVVYDELVTHLQYCVTGIDRPVQLSNTPIYLDAVIGRQKMWSPRKKGHKVLV
jgi:hypothetical protein